MAKAKKKAAAKKPAKRATLKTVATKGSVDAFLDSLDAQRRDECKAIATMMKAATGAPAKMWGSAIVGFGDWHYKYESGREGDFFEVGFSPRKAALTIYINGGYDKHAELMRKLGKYTIGKSCLYVKRLGDVDAKVLRELIDRGVADLRART